MSEASPGIDYPAAMTLNEPGELTVRVGGYVGGFLGKGLALGGGVIVAEYLRRRVAGSREHRYEARERRPYREFEKKVLIAGGGFGGYTAARTLCKSLGDRDDVGVMVISRDNFFTFWPMLAGVISSDVETRNVAQPLRRSLISHGASFRRAELESVDPERGVVRASGVEIPYDHLVLALGGEPSYFGIPGVRDNCISMNSIETAERIRNRVIERYEQVILARGEVPEGTLTFVVIGGGATGVETAAELHGLVHDVLPPDYPNIDPDSVRIVLVDRGEQVLKELDPSLRRAARKKLDDMNVEVLNNVKASEVTADRAILDEGWEIPSRNVIWTAGARASETVDRLDLPADELKGLTVDAYMRVEGHENIWGIGDCAANVDGEGEAIPPNAQAAQQGGEAVARNVLAAIDGGPLSEFEYRSMGQLVELGSRFAVNDVMGFRFSGFLASLFWRATYLFKLKSPQSRFRIATDWMLDLVHHPAVTQIRGRGS